MPACLVCSTSFEPFLDFGRMPIANGFLRREETHAEPFYRLRVGICGSCGTVQLADIVEQEKMFHENYAFFASTSARMSEHFRRHAEAIREAHLRGPDPFVVEIGSNDGILLQNFAARGIRHLGIEPSANVAEAARAKGVRTDTRFFDERLAREIVAEHGQADVFVGANVVCHIPYIHSVFGGVALLLKPDGVMIFEDPYLGDILRKTSYDQIYDEHVFYFCLASVTKALARHGLEVVDVEHLETHGGSMRYTVARKGARAPSDAVVALRDEEARFRLDDPATWHGFGAAVARSRDALVATLRGLKAEGKRVVGYGATSKSTTVTNYCGIGPDLVEFISDTTPTKQGKLSPGAHIPVKPYAEFAANPPDVALLFAWNHAAEILAKEQAFVAKGGRFLTYVPAVGFVP